VAELRETASQSAALNVVMLTGGPRVENDVVRLAARLEHDPDIELRAIFSESPVQGLSGVFIDLWRRRSVMAVPLFLLAMLRPFGNVIRHPLSSVRRWRVFRRIRPRLCFVPDLHDP
jgi:hypothetical protein